VGSTPPSGGVGSRGGSGGRCITPSCQEAGSRGGSGSRCIAPSWRGSIRSSFYIISMAAAPHSCATQQRKRGTYPAPLFCSSSQYNQGLVDVGLFGMVGAILVQKEETASVGIYIHLTPRDQAAADAPASAIRCAVPRYGQAPLAGAMTLIQLLISAYRHVCRFTSCMGTYICM
jgi:hypothetical protein